MSVICHCTPRPATNFGACSVCEGWQLNDLDPTDAAVIRHNARALGVVGEQIRNPPTPAGGGVMSVTLTPGAAAALAAFGEVWVAVASEPTGRGLHRRPNGIECNYMAIALPGFPAWFCTKCGSSGELVTPPAELVEAVNFCSSWVGSFCVADDMEGCDCHNGKPVVEVLAMCPSPTSCPPFTRALCRHDGLHSVSVTVAECLPIWGPSDYAERPLALVGTVGGPRVLAADRNDYQITLHGDPTPGMFAVKFQAVKQ